MTVVNHNNLSTACHERIGQCWCQITNKTCLIFTPMTISETWGDRPNQCQRFSGISLLIISKKLSERILCFSPISLIGLRINFILPWNFNRIIRETVNLTGSFWSGVGMKTELLISWYHLISVVSLPEHQINWQGQQHWTLFRINSLLWWKALASDNHLSIAARWLFVSSQNECSWLAAIGQLSSSYEGKKTCFLF